MKKCPVCKQTYTDDSLNFCLTDGGILTKVNDDPPPTVFMDKARQTNDTNWANPEPFSSWQNQPIAQNSPFMTPPVMQIQNQTLPTVSLVLGILSLILFCCWGGLPLGIAAMITGFIGMNNVKNNPSQYSGKGLAIGGMATGAVALVGTIIMFLIAVAGNIK